MMRVSAFSVIFLSGLVAQFFTSAYGDTCTNGLSGVQSGQICCAEECGMCGGVGCSQRPGGEDACCITDIRDADELCSTTREAPCIIDDDEMMESPMSTDDDSYSYDLESWYDDDRTDGTMWCRGGIPGVESEKGDVCCALGCGQCGGVGCSRFGAPELDSYDCCITEILDYGESCAATGEAPCYIGDD
ncbi:unnamed protein product [Scytosiphon promiscuus]